MRHPVLCSLLLLSVPMAIHASKTSRHAADPDTASLTANFSVTSPTAIPGKTLKTGNYTIQIVDHLTDRMILRVEGPNGKTESTFLGLYNGNLDRSGAGGPIPWTTGPNHERALRGYSFPGNLSVEFVYPKAEAVEIAKSNSDKVPAIDPASDNLPPNEQKLSHADMQIVTLWMLSTARVGPNGDTPAIEAEKYQAPVAPPAYQATNRQPLNPAVSIAASRTPRIKPTRGSASAARKPVVSRLPHTASELPVIMLTGIFSLLAIAGLRVQRTFSNES